jgi:hypothetical protein
MQRIAVTMPLRVVPVVCALLVGLVTLLTTGVRAAPSPPVRVLIPAYFYPAGAGRVAWDRLIASAGRAPIVVIANPATGPGEQADPNYREVIERAVGTGLKVIGYVNTDYGRRPRAKAEADVRRWVTLYKKIQGIFFDLQPSSGKQVRYYLELRKVVQEQIPEGLVVTNPGTLCVEEYISRDATDVVCLFENREGFEQYESPAWVSHYPRSRFAVLAYRVTEPDRMREYVRRAVRSGAGYLYITDADGANPWERLPSYWHEELETIRRESTK